MKRSSKKPSPAFMRSAARTAQGDSSVNEAILKQARKSGQLNLSNRSLEVVPSSVWRINTDPPTQQPVSFGQEDRWWDQTELIKLILADNEIKELSEEMKLLQALAVLDVHSNQITILPQAIGELGQLKRLVISHNKLLSLPSSLSSLENLQVLKLEHNKLTEIAVDFIMLRQLEDVDVSHNELSSLPPSLCSCTNIHTLAASNNKLDSLPPELGAMPKLKQLIINNNKLSTLPNFSHGSLGSLNCTYNRLTDLPVCEDASTIKELHYGWNKLSTLDPHRLTQFSSVIILDLRENSISSIPECIVELQHLERLDLTSNNLTNLPYAMGNMACLKSLVLDGNPFRTLRQSIIQKGTIEVLKYLKSRIQTDDNEQPAHNTTKFTPTKQKDQATRLSETTRRSELSVDAREVDLSKQDLTELPEKIFSVIRLTSLNLGFNKVKAIPPAIAVFTAMTVLDIRNNQLTDLPQELGQCSKLRDLILSNNQFSGLPSVIYSLKELEAILANSNHISDIDVDGLLQLPMLATLDLQNNSISQVPPRLGTVTSLKHLELKGNPFRTPRIAILAKGSAAVMEYLRGRIPA